MRISSYGTKTYGWRVEADLNNDIVGATRGQNGVVNPTRLRVFSERHPRSPNWTVALVYRLDRFGRGGDHSAFNALAAASMASAPPPPVNVKVAGAVTPDTQLSWTASLGFPAAGAFWGQ
jgi:hypothetical protein